MNNTLLVKENSDQFLSAAPTLAQCLRSVLFRHLLLWRWCFYLRAIAIDPWFIASNILFEHIRFVCDLFQEVQGDFQLMILLIFHQHPRNEFLPMEWAMWLIPKSCVKIPKTILFEILRTSSIPHTVKWQYSFIATCSTFLGVLTIAGLPGRGSHSSKKLHL